MTGPTPKAGILDIGAYVPGKSSAEGVANPIKLSANENILGSSKAARTPILRPRPRLNRYPDPRATKLRTAIAAKFDLEPRSRTIPSASRRS